MDLEREQNEEQKIELTEEMVGDISFEDVCFRYGSRKEIFSALNLTIEKGKMTAIVGESGSGKNHTDVTATTYLPHSRRTYPHRQA